MQDRAIHYDLHFCQILSAKELTPYDSLCGIPELALAFHRRDGENLMLHTRGLAMAVFC